MEELITPFNDYPIEFKELNPDDFEFFNVAEKIIITPNADGYINRELQNAIDLSTKNTVVVNAGVGQGKTYSIIQLVKQYYELEEYVIFIASPYMSLVQQYYDKTIDCGIPEDKIYRYENIGTNRDINPEDSRVHILTVNALLGNPGEDALINSQAKRDYINQMVKYCEDNNKKAVFIYDEIHDAIHNFKEEYIFTLWKWRNVIHKNLIISATFNEASKIVIKYLANLTEKKIQLIESKRIRIVNRQSELYLYYNNKQNYLYNDEGITKLVESLLQKGKNIDILCYSKKLAKDICDTEKTDGVSKVLQDSTFNIQKCTSGLVENQRPDRETPSNRYDPLKCNVGTNFKTGISIEKENHAFVIIMPPKGAKNLFRNKYGIFTDGINAIIQAFARQRKQGEIHVILPSPDTIDYSTLPFIEEGEKIAVFKQLYDNGRDSSEDSEGLVKHIDINTQKNILKAYYDDVYRKNVEEEINFINTQTEEQNTPKIEFPSFEKFVLVHGEKYLADTYFSADLSSIVTYYAITNQFTNCKLVSIKGKSLITVTQANLVEDLTRFYSNTVESDYYQNALYYADLFANNDLNNFWGQEEHRREGDYFSDILNNADRELYIYLRNALFEYFIIHMQNTNGQIITVDATGNNKYIEQAILAVYHNYRCSPYYNVNVNEYSFTQPYTRADYFRANILHAINLSNKIQDGIIEVEDSTKELIDAYMSMKYFISKIKIDSTTIRNEGTVEYLLNKPDELFIGSEDTDRFITMINSLIEKDYFICNEIFDFKNSFEREDYNEEQKINYFYKCLMNDFFDTDKKDIRRMDMPRSIYIINKRFLPEGENLVDYPNFLLLFE
ncbi:DEAD/DEAH box helicase family protein [Myroides odoratimimus]|uniref:DEAD/DEAH box helicase family protein n=1 Tax=Myroides odoratimimus TaxID=76832 RepID=UPI002576D8B1|nr:DEAD/DEAH box helicase family protein [Myroides odoratimimus]MDM1499488.1 DEAD/DEAH box helicase family protein [Myroides odoratimimus]